MTVYKRLRAALLALAVLGFMSGAAFADSAVSLFVGKSEVKGVVHGGKVYVPADLMLKAMGYGWTATGDSYTLQPGTAGGPAIGAGAHFRLGTRDAAPQTMMVKGKTWVEAGAMTQGLGGFYLYSPGVGIAQATFGGTKISQADLTKAVKDARKEAQREDEAEAKRRATSWQSSSGNGSSSGSSGDSGSSDSDKTKSTKGEAPTDDEPIAVERITFSTAVTGIMKGHVVLKNDAEVPIRNFFVYITMQAPDEPGQGPPKYASGAGGGATLPAYVHNTTDGSLPTYGGTPPVTITSGYPEQASESGGPTSTGTGPRPAPTPSPAAEASPSPEAKPTPTPMHVVATLPAIFVAEIQPGQTLSVPFEWQNTKGVQQVQPSVQTQHEKVDFTRKKAKGEDDEDTDKDKKSGDESADKKSDDKKTDDKTSDDKKADEKKSDDKKTDDKKSDDKKTDDKKSDDKKSDTK